MLESDVETRRLTLSTQSSAFTICLTESISAEIFVSFPQHSVNYTRNWLKYACM